MSHQNTNYEEVLLVLRELVHATDIRSRRLIRDYGLTGPQLVVLRALSVDSEASPGTLAAKVQLSHGTVTGILDRLEKRSLIRRLRSETDRRRVRVSLEDAGLRVLADAPPLMHEEFIEQFVKLSNWEQTQILSSLQRLAAMMNVTKKGREPVLENDLLDVDQGREKAAPLKTGKEYVAGTHVGRNLHTEAC